VVNQGTVRGEGEGAAREREGTTGVVVKVERAALGCCHQLRAVIMAAEVEESVKAAVARRPAAAQGEEAQVAHMAPWVLQVRPTPEEAEAAQERQEDLASSL
jgi:hypothetical protein